MEGFHRAALLKELLELLEIAPGMIVVDGTVGGGGHAEAVLEKMRGEGKLIGIDRDPEAIQASQELVKKFGESVALVSGRFSCLLAHLKQLGIEKVDRIYFDLGVSSHQLESAERGFSYKRNGPLDMRMNPNEGKPVSELIKSLEQAELERIFQEYGEEKFSNRVARAIIRERKRGRNLDRTLEMAGLVKSAVGGSGAWVRSATRIFQALRIYVNQELEELKEGLRAGLEALKSGGRIAVISYHSLEDRVVKNFYRENQKAGILRVLTEKPIVPSRAEVMNNPRSRSAKLRVAERI